MNKKLEGTVAIVTGASRGAGKGITCAGPLVEVSEAAGFHDLAHLNRAFNEVFGLNPSTVFDPGQVRLVRCAWD